MKKNKSIPMRALSVTGVSTSGKTTVVEELVAELTKRGYSVGTIKSIGCGKGCEAHKNGTCDGSGVNHHIYGFSIDTKGKNSFRHREAGAKQTGTWAKTETALIFPYQMKLYEIIENYDFDFLVVEGGKRYSMPRIATGIDDENINIGLNETTIAISGKIADKVEEIKGIKTYKTFEDIEKLADLVEEKIYPSIGYRDEVGCKMCGMTCKEMNVKILKGEKTYKDCIRNYPEIEMESEDLELREKVRKALVKIEIEDFPSKIKIEF